MAAAPGAPAPTNQFDVARKRAQQQAAQAVQGQQEALQRKFASLGNLQSGAAIKQQQLAAEKGQEQLQGVNEGIDAAEMADQQRKQELAQQQQFAREERLGSQEFAGGQSALARALQESQFGKSLAEQVAGRTQQGEQFGLSLANQKDQFGQSLGEQKAGRIQQGEQFGKSLGEQVQARLQQGSQFGQSLKEQQAGRTQQNQQFYAGVEEQKAGRLQTGDLARAQMKQQGEQFGQSLGFEKQKFDTQEIHDLNAELSNAASTGLLNREGMYVTIDPKTGRFVLTPAEQVLKQNQNVGARNPNTVNPYTGQIWTEDDRI